MTSASQSHTQSNSTDWDLVEEPVTAATQEIGRPPIIVQAWHAVKRRRWIVAAIVGASLILTIILTLVTTPQFTSITTLAISREQKRVTNVEGLDAPEAGQNQEFYQTQYSLLEARSIAERVATHFQLARNDDFFQAHGATPAVSANSKSAIDRVTIAGRQRQAVRLLLKHVTIEPIPRSSLVKVKYTSASPLLSQRIANDWASQFIQASMDRRMSSTADARKFLEARLNELRQRLDQSERDLVNYTAGNNIVNLGPSQDANGRTSGDRTLVASDLDALNQALATATAERITAQSRLSANAGGNSNPALNGAALSGIRERRAVVAADYAKARSQFEAGYPQVQSLRQQLSDLDASIAREVSRGRDSARADFVQAQDRESLLRRQVQTLTSQFIGQQRSGIQANIYRREVDTNRQLYEALLQRYKEIGVAGVAANDIAVVDVAEEPTAPSSPNLPLNLAIALFAGAVLAGGTVFGLEQIDEGLREPSRVAEQLGVPLLGVTPVSSDNGSVLEALFDPKSVLSEAYLTIQSNLSFATNHGLPRSLLITSTAESEGKSTTSVAIATMIARSGRSVVLIDADMRSPSVHEMLDLTNHEGLSNLLSGSDNWQAMLQTTRMKTLSVLSAGPKPPSAPELLQGDAFSRVVHNLLETFDHVVIDAPPMLGLADAPLLARCAEGALYVVESSRLPVRGVRTGITRLMTTHARVFGVVLTKYQAAEHAGAYGYGYGHGYGYGRE